MAFENRAEAGQMLARRLEKFRDEHPLVLAIPRGAVPMGKVVADALDGELDVVLVRKLRAPQNPELAIGSIDEIGTVYMDPDTRDLWDEWYLEDEKKAQLETIQRRRRMYQPAGSPIAAAGRVVIVLDDGIATGATMIAALRAVRARHPAKLIAAAGVASSVAKPMKSSASRRPRSCTPLGITSATFLKCRMKTSSRLSRARGGQACRSVRAADVHDRARRALRRKR
jgi:putative phosphoribosyl transferase